METKRGQQGCARQVPLTERKLRFHKPKSPVIIIITEFMNITDCIPTYPILPFMEGWGKGDLLPLTTETETGGVEGCSSGLEV